MCASVRYVGGGKRSSNLELYRIICMIGIVAHHYVENSGLTSGPMQENPEAWNTLYLTVFGMWGKTGINCFMMITGYFMCKSQITLRKFFKLMIWIYLYKFILFGILCLTGYECMSVSRIIKLIMPISGFNSNFTSCFLGFWLTIPFWNILTRNMSQKQHISLTALLLLFYTIVGSIPSFIVTFNYITWFGIIYLIASYIRLYPQAIFDNKRLWMMVSVISILVAIISVLLLHFIGRNDYFFVSDSNKIFAVAVAVSTFLWFKNIKLKYSKIINIIGGTTFGVLLIHANSDAMRHWLWTDTVDCVGHYSLPLPQLILFSVGAVLAIFFICSAIDRVRQLLIEEPFFNWYDTKNISQRITEKFNAFSLIKKLNQNNG